MAKDKKSEDKPKETELSAVPAEDDAAAKQAAAIAKMKAATMQTDEAEAKPTDQIEDETRLYIKVYSAYQTYYDGFAASISAANDTGPFDILPKHHNFMTLVNEGEVVIRPINGQESRLRIARGIMHVRKNKVTLFLDV